MRLLKERREQKESAYYTTNYNSQMDQSPIELDEVEENDFYMKGGIDAVIGEQSS